MKILKFLACKSLLWRSKTLTSAGLCGLVAAMSMGLSACGQKGALVLPAQGNTSAPPLNALLLQTHVGSVHPHLA